MHKFLYEEKEDHPLARIDPRIKLLCAAAVLAMVLTNTGVFFPSGVATACLCLCAWLRVPLRRLLVRFSEPALIVAVLIAIKCLFGGKEPMAVWRVLGVDITLYRDGLAGGLLLGLRIISAIFVVAVLDFATPFTRLLGALAWFRVPKGIVETALFAYRYIFLLLEDATVIYNAQKNRLGYSSLRRALSSAAALVAALVLKAFDGSQHAAVAMTQRGYDGAMPSMGHERLKTSHLAASTAFLLLMGVLWRM
jgi:cobalt/nickel transport system permease protein